MDSGRPREEPRGDLEAVHGVHGHIPEVKVRKHVVGFPVTASHEGVDAGGSCEPGQSGGPRPHLMGGSIQIWLLFGDL